MSEKCSKSSKKKRNGNIRNISPARWWFITLNNHTEEEIKDIESVCSTDIYLFKEEIGSKGTPHINGFICFEKKCRPINKFIKGPNGKHRICWLKIGAKKITRDRLLSNLLYGLKEDTRMPGGRIWFKNIPAKYGNEKTPLNNIKLEDLHPWCRQVLTILTETPHPRDIWWIWDKGNTMKSRFQKYLHRSHDAVIVSGNRSDMKNGITTWIKEHKGESPKIIIINIPKNEKVDRISWPGIEEIKDGFFYSGKYEGGWADYNRPHVVMFANVRAPVHTLVKDKWKIRTTWLSWNNGLVLCNEVAIALIQRAHRVKMFQRRNTSAKAGGASPPLEATPISPGGRQIPTMNRGEKTGPSPAFAPETQKDIQVYLWEKYKDFDEI